MLNLQKGDKIIVGSVILNCEYGSTSYTITLSDCAILKRSSSSTYYSDYDVSGLCYVPYSSTNLESMRYMETFGASINSRSSSLSWAFFSRRAYNSTVTCTVLISEMTSTNSISNTYAIEYK